MRFVRTEDLAEGMRLAKPIYNKDGVLLFDRNSVLTPPGISSIYKFGLIGVYTLEPAEPLPPLSQEDIQFEQLQTMYIFRLQEAIDAIIKRKKIPKFAELVDNILRYYGALDHRVNFNQNLRSTEDFMYKHALSTAILMAMMTSRMGYTPGKQKSMIAAALLYGIGYRYVPASVLSKGQDLNPNETILVQQSLERGVNMLTSYQNDFDFFPTAFDLITNYVYSTSPRNQCNPDDAMKYMMQVFQVADTFDRMTAMNLGHEPESEIAAMNRLKERPDLYHPHIVGGLAECIHIVPPAASVDLSTGDAGIILVENPADYMHPVVLNLTDNQIYDLSNPKVAREIWIIDIMKTMDNRIQVDELTLRQFMPDDRLKDLTRKFQEKLAQYHEKYPECYV